MSNCLELEIGSTVANRINIRYRGIPDPDNWTFRPYSTTKLALNGLSKGFGFPLVSWSWDALDQLVIDTFLDFFSSELDASVTVHIQTYKDNGKGLSDMLGTYEAIMHRPVDGDGKTVIPESTTPIYAGVTINFTHLVSE